MRHLEPYAQSSLTFLLLNDKQPELQQYKYNDNISQNKFPYSQLNFDVKFWKKQDFLLVSNVNEAPDISHLLMAMGHT
jgi:hypothetical protein